MFTKKYFIYAFILIIFRIKNILLPINIESNKLFYYYTTLYYGKQNIPQTFIIDTTSSIISSPCSLCSTCGYHSNEWFNISDNENEILSCNDYCRDLSGNCENNQCSYKYDYYENAYIKGVYVKENISFEQNSSDSYIITIGCTLNETNYIIAQDSDGIMGLNNDENSFINILYKSKIISNNLFTIYLNQNNSGFLSLGEINIHKNFYDQINYVPFIIDNNNYYTLEVNSLEVNGKIIDCKKIAILDTSASLSSFPEQIYEQIIKEFDEKCHDNTCGKLIKNRNFGVCSIFNNEHEMLSNIKNWLNISINFQQYRFEWNPKNYWVNISTEHNFRACLGFESTEEDIITLGTTFFHGYDVIFDRETNEIGFLEINNNEKLNITKMKIKNNSINFNNYTSFTFSSSPFYSFFSHILQNKIFLIIIIIFIIFAIVLIIFYYCSKKNRMKKYKKISDKEKINFV